MKRIQVVDLVRALSILTVLAAHLGCHYMTLPSLSPFLRTLWFKIWINGAFGVTAFFVVSGFVITRLIASQPGGLFQPDFRDFYARRAGRILPLLALTCLFGITMISFFPGPSHPFEYCFKGPQAVFTPGFWFSIATFSLYWYKPLFHIPSTYYGLHWDLLWSLSVEEQFYFCYPYLLKKLGNERNLRRLLVAMVFYPPLFNTLHYFYFPDKAVPVLGSLEPFGALAAGCLLCLVSGRFKGALSADPKASLAILFSGLALFLSAYLHQDYKADTWGHIFGFSFISWGTALFLLGGLHLEFFNSKYWSFAVRPGALSYGGYLIHPAVLYFLWPHLAGRNEFLAFFLFAAATFTVAWLSYRYFEMPANAWVRRTFGREPAGA